MNHSLIILAVLYTLIVALGFRWDRRNRMRLLTLQMTPPEGRRIRFGFVDSEQTYEPVRLRYLKFRGPRWTVDECRITLRAGDEAAPLGGAPDPPAVVFWR